MPPLARAHNVNEKSARSLKGAYGESEFIFWSAAFFFRVNVSDRPLTATYASSIKVITIVGLIILGIIIDLGGGPNHDRIGFRYWRNPGLFAQYDGIAGIKGRFLGWSAVVTQAAFSYVGTEVVAVGFLFHVGHPRHLCRVRHDRPTDPSTFQLENTKFQLEN